jgi:HEPN domain-containing protein
MAAERINPQGALPFPISVKCPVCKENGMFHPAALNVNDFQWHQQAGSTGKYRSHFAGIRMCPKPECKAIVYIAGSEAKVLEQHPATLVDFDSTNLPGPILSSLEEAIRCFSTGAYRATALMVRRTLEELCADRGGKGSDLKARLKSLSQTITLPADLMDAADHLRLLGNDAAHLEAKTYDSVGKEEAQLALELAKELLKATYQYASLVHKLKALQKPAPTLG